MPAAPRSGAAGTTSPRFSSAATTMLVGTVEEVVARLREYAEAGVERVFLQHLDHADLDMVPLIGAAVVPAFG